MYAKEVRAAAKALVEAAKLAEMVAVTLDDAETLTKADLSPVTLADYGVQAIVHRHLAEACPSDPIVAEEDSDDLEQPDNAGLRSRLLEVLNEVCGPWRDDEMIAHIRRGGHGGGASGRFWTLDPIDGTKGYIRGDQYAMALALLESGRPVAGLLGCPRLDLPVEEGSDEFQRGWVIETNGTGVTASSLDGRFTRPLHTSELKKPADLIFCEPVEAKHSAHGWTGRIAEMLGVHRPPLRMDSQAKYAAVAAGRADAYLRLPTRSDYQEKIWDHAAGAFIVASAGGIVTDIDGKPLDFSLGRTLSSNRGIIAAAPGIHAGLVEAVRETAA